MASSQDVLNAIPSMKIERVAVAIPKFKFESEYKENLMESLNDIGLNAPFEGELCKIFDDCSVKISDVIQKTVIDVNEQGVEAAAVTLIGVDRVSKDFIEVSIVRCDLQAVGRVSTDHVTFIES